MFRELGKSKRPKAPMPPSPAPSAAPRTNYKSISRPHQHAQFIGIGAGGVPGRQALAPAPTPRQSVAHQHQPTGQNNNNNNKNSLTLRNERVTRRDVGSVFSPDKSGLDPDDEAAIAELIEDFDATIRMHEEQLGVLADDDDGAALAEFDENRACSPTSSSPKKGSLGRSQHVRKLSGPTSSASGSAHLPAATKPPVMPRQQQQQRVVGPVSEQLRRH